MLSSIALVCQPEITLATPFGGVVHPLLSKQAYQSSSLGILGDWYSDAVLVYLTVPLSVRLESVYVIAKIILTYNQYFFFLSLFHLLGLEYFSFVLDISR